MENKNKNKIEFFSEVMNFEYIRSPGDLTGKFLSNLKEENQIMGIRCSFCSDTFVPPQLYCPNCKQKMTNFVRISPRGTVQYFTIVKKDTPFTDFPIPFAYVGIKFNGSNSIFWHRMKDTDIDINIEVKAIFKAKEEKEGSILDINYFEKV